MKLPEIVGIAGTNGAGKDELADLRLRRADVQKVSLSDILRIEATKRGLDHSRENLSSISSEWARAYGTGALALMTLRRHHEDEHQSGLSIVSVRRPAEACAIQEEGGAVIWVDADRKVRYYDRILKANRGRVDDVVSYEEFCDQEDRELNPVSDDPAVPNMAGVRDIADVYVFNEFSTRSSYQRHLINRFDM